MSRRSASSSHMSSSVGGTGVGQTPPRTHIMAAKAAGNKADQIQDGLRRNLANPIAPITAGGMKAVARMVMARNQELKYLAAHVATSNVQAPPGHRSKDAVPHPIAGLSKGRAGGALWNVISARFAEAAVGKAQVIHAAQRWDS